MMKMHLGYFGVISGAAALQMQQDDNEVYHPPTPAEMRELRSGRMRAINNFENTLQEYQQKSSQCHQNLADISHRLLQAYQQATFFVPPARIGELDVINIHATVGVDPVVGLGPMDGPGPMNPVVEGGMNPVVEGGMNSVVEGGPINPDDVPGALGGMNGPARRDFQAKKASKTFQGKMARSAPNAAKKAEDK